MLKSEFTKILSLRSAYIVAGVLAILSCLAGGVTASLGVPAKPGSELVAVLNVQGIVSGALGTCATILAVVAVLIVINEYRYNTIAYTVTASRSRVAVYFSKLIAALGYGLVVGLIASALAVIAALIVLGGSGATVTTQEFNVGSLLLHEVLRLSFYIIIGVSLGFIIRSIIVPIVVIFALPIVESIASILLKESAQFLPFNSINAVAQIGENAASAGVVIAALVYVGGFMALSLILFTKRDA